MAASGSSKGWGTFVAFGEKSKAVKHFDRTENKDVSDDGLRKGSDFTFRLGRTILGRVLMNSEGTARAQQQVADLAVDIASGNIRPSPSSRFWGP